MTDKLNLTGRVAMVTGGGQGIGRQIALDFAAQGATVVVNDYVAERAEAVAAEVAAAGGTAIGRPGDVTDHDRMKEIAATVAEAHGPIGILVNNAGNSGANPDKDLRKPFYETSPEVWNSFIGVNLYGVMNSTAAVLPGMIEAKFGRVITIVSEAGRYGDAGLEMYAAAKAGAAGFTRSVARSMGRHGITANTIAIAATLTPAIEDRLAENPERTKKILEKYVIRRVGRPSDVANMALFLASDASEYITGQTYPVNGGFTFNL